MHEKNTIHALLYSSCWHPIKAKPFPCRRLFRLGLGNLGLFSFSDSDCWWKNHTVCNYLNLDHLPWAHLLIQYVSSGLGQSKEEILYFWRHFYCCPAASPSCFWASANNHPDIILINLAHHPPSTMTSCLCLEAANGPKSSCSHFCDNASCYSNKSITSFHCTCENNSLYLSISVVLLGELHKWAQQMLS